MFQNLPHGEQRTRIEVRGQQQYHAVHSSRKRTHTHKPTSRSTVRGCHKGKSMKRGWLQCRRSSSKRRKNIKLRVVEIEKKRKLRMAEMRFVFGFAWAWLALVGRKAIPWLFTSFRHFEPPEHVPRTSARAHTCTQCSRGPPACPAPDSKRKDRRAEEQKMPMSGKLHVILSNISYIYTRVCG